MLHMGTVHQRTLIEDQSLQRSIFCPKIPNMVKSSQEISEGSISKIIIMFKPLFIQLITEICKHFLILPVWSCEALQLIIQNYTFTASW